MSPSDSRWSEGVKVALIALPILYILSIGPVDYWLVRSHSIDLRLFAAVNVFYKPLGLLYDHTPLRVPLDAYLTWWRELGGGTP